MPGSQVATDALTRAAENDELVREPDPAHRLAKRLCVTVEAASSRPYVTTLVFYLLTQLELLPLHT